MVLFRLGGTLHLVNLWPIVSLDEALSSSYLSLLFSLSILKTDSNSFGVALGNIYTAG